MTSSPKPWRRRLPLGLLMASLACAASIATAANLPHWLQHVVAGTPIESALYRAMQLPGVEILYPRPPAEAQGALAHLIETTPNPAELYQLRAQVDEQALDQRAAEEDWKLYAAHSTQPVDGKLALAAYYERRLLIPQAIATLREVAALPAAPEETYRDPYSQQSWQAFERILTHIADQALPPQQARLTYEAFLARYPAEPAVYARALAWLIAQQDYPAADALIVRYRTTFPQDAVFPIRAQAALVQARDGADAALLLYDRAFDPLWPQALIHSWFALLEQAHRQRAFVAQARIALEQHPDGPAALNALARIFFYDQQAGRLDAAQRTLDAFRSAPELRNAPWAPSDLHTLATLAASTHNDAEAARYNYALASLPTTSPATLPNGQSAAEAGLAGLVHILLEAPDQPLALGARNLTLYRDIATLDQGPGYWNGILSLWLNGTSPASEYDTENARAQSYFHRAKAAELLAELDRRFPRSPERPALHARLLAALAQYGQPALVITGAKAYLADFPADSTHPGPARPDVINLLADAYAQQNDTTSEFALYESELAALAGQCAGQPLTAAAPAAPDPTPDPGSDSGTTPAEPTTALLAPTPVRRTLPAATAYSRLLDRYLGRLTALNQLPRALTVLRVQLDRSPGEPLLYERLATFLQQNNLSAEQEHVFEQAIARFGKDTYYDKLARLYLREKKREAFAALARNVTGIFSGSELDRFFTAVNPAQPIGPQLSLQLNLYAAKRFPHDLDFTRNLLVAYQAKATADPAALESLLRHTWFAAPDIETFFFTYLSRTGKLQAELAALEPPANSQSATITPPNPAALRERAQLHLFTSHFEQAAPLLDQLAALFPADSGPGDQAVSVFRSLAYADPTPASRKRAVALEQNLLAAEPFSAGRLTTLGDLYAESTASGGEDLAAAAPFFRRVPTLHPGSAQGFLASATLFWDYFQYDAALSQLNAARTQLHSPFLFQYEAGAIAENLRDLPGAVAQYTQAAIHLAPPYSGSVPNLATAADPNLWSPPASSEAAARLLTLATRPSTAALVEAATAQAVAEHPTDLAALTLRAHILLARRHPEALAALLDNALAHARTADQAAALAAFALDRNLTPAYERALTLEAGLTPDPVQKLELEYTLARSFEARNRPADAAHVIDAVYHDNPRLLGVVRATTDFYARSGQPARAIATLLEAARAATPGLARDFTLEAASRANQADDPAQARALATTLLAQAPYDPRVLDLIATSYARANDDAGLKRFYLARLELARSDPATAHDPAARRQRLALLRRGILPALTRLNDFAGALEQYLQLIAAFPEDTATARQAALYALEHAQQPRLLDFLRTTVRQSPRDARFAILLAQTEETFEDLPAARAAYDAAIDLRKDRTDLYTARLDLELRLNDLEPAARDLDRLYRLTYHDPAWMVRLAELRARQQRPADAVQALRTAWLDGHPPNPRDLFTVAALLAQWNLLAEARSFAEQAVQLAGDNLLTPPQPTHGAATYAQILTRLGHPQIALATLIAARRAADLSAASPSVLAAELARANLADDEAADFRRNFAAQHRQAADSELTAALSALGGAIATYATPEQKLAFAQQLDTLHAASPARALEAATAAGLTDREALWRRQLLLTGSLRQAAQSLEPYTTLERQRLAFAELGQTLEAYAARLKPADRHVIRQQAADAYRDAGDPTSELRLTRTLAFDNDASRAPRFFALLLEHDPEALAALAASPDTTLADAALNYTVAHASRQQALAAIAGRGRALPAVWRPASASLVETYFASAGTPAINPADFTQSLESTLSIGDRLGKPADPRQQLTGDLFFDYASRYGIFLATTRQPGAEAFLPAALELQPTSPDPYLELARTYAEASNPASAIAEYTHALELAPSVSTEDEFATFLDRAGHHPEALEHFHAALALLDRMQQRKSYPERFFTSFVSITGHLREQNLFLPFRSDLSSLLAAYLAHNGNYRSNELLEAVFTASPTPADGTALILQLATSAANPAQVLADLANAPWLPPPAAEAMLERRLTLAPETPAPAAYTLDSLRQSLLDSYLARHEDSKAVTLLKTIPSSEQANPPYARARVLLAARSGQLATLLAQATAQPANGLSDEVLTAVADTLAAQPDRASARTLREFTFARRQLAHTLIPTDFLALAQSRLDTGDLPGALTLLHRLTLQPAPEAAPTSDSITESTPDPSPNTDAAAHLLEITHHPAEALPLLEALTQAAPWNPAYRLRLGQAQLAAGQRPQAIPLLVAIAQDATAPYLVRLAAARALASQPLPPNPNFGSRELTLLTQPTPTRPDSLQPYAFATRLALAAHAPASTTLLREAIAIAPRDPASYQARLTLLLARPATADPYATLALLPATQDSDPDATPTPQDSTAATLPAAARSLPLATRIRLATQLSTAFERTGDLANALAYAQLAVTLDPARPALAHRTAHLKEILRLEQQNATRQPQFHTELAQSNQVRPRLVPAPAGKEPTP